MQISRGNILGVVNVVFATAKVSWQSHPKTLPTNPPTRSAPFPTEALVTPQSRQDLSQKINDTTVPP